MAAPLLIPAIMAGTTLLSGLMGQAAQKAENERNRKLQGQLQGLQTAQQGIQAQTQGTQGAMQQLIDSYRSALL